MARADIPFLCADLTDLLRGCAPEIVSWDVAGLVSPDVVTVEALARLRVRGGWVEVTTSHGDWRAIVKLRNSGDHVLAAEVAPLFEPFQRLASHRAVGSKSIGVGLAILGPACTPVRPRSKAAPNAGGGLTMTATVAEHPPAAEPSDQIPAK